MEKSLASVGSPVQRRIEDALTRLQSRRAVTPNQTIKVAFFASAPVYTDGSVDSQTIMSTFRAVPDDATLRRAIFDRAIAPWNIYANVDFQFVTDPALADVRIGLFDDVVNTN